jgi:hypothetical protein
VLVRRRIFTWGGGYLHEEEDTYMRRRIFTWGGGYLHEEEDIYMRRRIFTWGGWYLHEEDIYMRRRIFTRGAGYLLSLGFLLSLRPYYLSSLYTGFFKILAGDVDGVGHTVQEAPSFL